jgi:hypothetical protein
MKKRNVQEDIVFHSYLFWETAYEYNGARGLIRRAEQLLNPKNIIYLTEDQIFKLEEYIISNV